MRFLGMVFVDTNSSNLEEVLYPFSSEDDSCDGRFDWHDIGGQWTKYLLGKDGKFHSELGFNDIDWEHQFDHKPGEWDRLPYCIIDLNEEWHTLDVPEQYKYIVADFPKKVIESVRRGDHGIKPEDVVVYAVEFHC